MYQSNLSVDGKAVQEAMWPPDGNTQQPNGDNNDRRNRGLYYTAHQGSA